MMGWLTSFYIDSGVLAADAAQIITSLLWVSLLIGRFSCSVIAAKFHPWQMITVMCFGVAAFLVLLVTGTVNQRNKDVLKNIYDQMPEPKAVIAIGACACTGGVFQDCYNVVGGVDHVIPVDVYVPGCAAKPEAIIDGVVLALEVVKGKLGLRDMPQTTIFE